MPGYGILPEREGTGLLAWAWAEERLVASHDYWVASTWPDGRPHLMPVWGMWHEDALWFSSAIGSRKARNLSRDGRCTVSTSDAYRPVVVEGVADRVVDAARLRPVLAAENAKYETDYGEDWLDPATIAWFRIAVRWAFALDEDDFPGSPTVWRFGG